MGGCYVRGSGVTLPGLGLGPGGHCHGDLSCFSKFPGFQFHENEGKRSSSHRVLMRNKGGKIQAVPRVVPGTQNVLNDISPLSYSPSPLFLPFPSPPSPLLSPFLLPLFLLKETQIIWCLLAGLQLDQSW